MKPPRSIPVIALVVVLAVGLSGAPAARAVAATPLRLTIAFTGDVGGYLEPCG